MLFICIYMCFCLQVGSQPATEALPLVMEPESRMYCHPVVVLDFQSLYPSMVIAYNLCYSTCVGRPAHAAAAAVAAASAHAAAANAAAASSQQQSSACGGLGLRSSVPQHPAGSGVRLGVTSYAPPADALLPGGAVDPEGLVIAPNGVAFLPPSVRPGVLPRLLHEILATRVMVKAAMKRCKADKVGFRVLGV
jgi:DNA polymerase zeta